MMNPKTFRRIFIIFVLLASAIPFVTISAQQNQPLGQTAREAVASANGIPVGQLVEMNYAESVVGPDSTTVFSFKFMDEKTGMLYQVSLDAAGQPVDVQQLVEQARLAREALYGRVDPALAEKLAVSSTNAPLRVIIWLNESEESTGQWDDDGGTNAAEMDEANQQRIQDLASSVALVTAPIVERLSSMGFAAKSNTLVPFVYTNLPPQVISQVSAWSEVRMIYEDYADKNALDIAWKSMGYWYSFFKYHKTGRGVKVGVVEVDGRAASANPYLDWYTQDTTNVCASPSAHATAVLGIIFSAHPSYTGFATGSTAWVGGSCGGYISETQAAASAAASWGAWVINYSAGSNVGNVPTSNDIFWDNLVRNSNVTAVIAAGNEANGCGAGNANVTSPALGYNMISVGNYNDANTESWADDTMNSCSSYVDPSSTHGDREKPEVSATGTNINATTTAYPWVGGVGSGTSYAAPVVSSAAVLALERRFNIGTGWASERIKALLIAGATHNIEGVNRLSDKDGAGALYMWETDRIAAEKNSASGWTTYACSSATPLTLGTIYLYGNTRTRVAISWQQNPSYANYLTQPNADLDLVIYSPTNSVVTGSYSWDNSYEIVDFITPAVTGNYTVKVNRIRCDMDPEQLGWAWWQK